jgi:hypothetical protein
MSPEGKLQARAIAYARKCGMLVKRNYMGSGAEVGWPDVEIFCPGGRVVLVEFKAPHKALRPTQKYKIHQLHNLGHEAHVCDSFEDFSRIIDAARGDAP